MIWLPDIKLPNAYLPLLKHLFRNRLESIWEIALAPVKVFEPDKWIELPRPSFEPTKCIEMILNDWLSAATTSSGWWLSLPL